MSTLAKYKPVIDEYGLDDPTISYSVDILNNKIPAGKKMKQACTRQMDDLLAVVTGTETTYTYNQELAERIVEFATLLKDVTSGQPFKPSLYQKFMLAMMVAWRVNDEDNGARFKTIFISMARTNGKTQLLATYGLFLFLFGQPKVNRQIAVASIDIQHTTNLYKYMTFNWEELSKGAFKKLNKKLGIEFNRNEMRIPKNRVTLKKLSAQGSPADSDHYTIGIVDEYHLLGYGQKEFVNSMTSGMINNEQAQMVYISTAGTNPNGSPMYEDYVRFSKGLEEKSLSDRVLFLVWEQDDVSEMYETDSWIKANPLMEIPKLKKALVQGMLAERDEKLSSGSQAEFIVKNMNMWQNAKENRYLDLETVNSAITDRPISMFGRDVFIGYDFSQVSDDTSLSFVFPYKEDDQEKFYIYQHSFVPTAQVKDIQSKEKRDSIPYRQAEDSGFATIATNRYGLIDGDQVFDWLMHFIEDNELKVQGFLYDQWQSDSFIRRLDAIKNEILIIPVRQGIKSLNEPTKFLQEEFIKGNITIANDPVMQAGLSNAVLVADNNGVKIDKNKATQKIDCVDATINAFYEGMFYFTEFTNVDEKNTKSVFGNMTNEEISDHFLNDFSF
ncbi:terminase large subunit [Weissella viridescens]|uniref:terminase large subunit n=1 Tax=Weissella viridescens TaxID=1629 RepID=UPI003AF2327F